MECERTVIEAQAILIAELQHRVRNTLATTRLVARRSAELSENLEDYASHLDGRLATMARVQAMILHDPGAGVDLGRLVTDELAGVHAYRDEKSCVEGPDLKLHLRAAEPFALALHELTTNTLKFGALASPSGRLSVSWRIEKKEGHSKLVFDWIESEVALDEKEPHRRGFGTVVLLEMVPHNLKADADLSFDATGMRYRIVLPLTERVVFGPTRPTFNEPGSISTT